MRHNINSLLNSGSPVCRLPCSFQFQENRLNMLLAEFLGFQNRLPFFSSFSFVHLEMFDCNKYFCNQLQNDFTTLLIHLVSHQWQKRACICAIIPRQTIELLFPGSSSLKITPHTVYNPNIS